MKPFRTEADEREFDERLLKLHPEYLPTPPDDAPTPPADPHIPEKEEDK